MEIKITKEERDYLLSLLQSGRKDKILRNKLLKEKRKRKRSVYKKCEKEKKERFEKLEEVIRGNFNLTNEQIYEKLEISKATFYKIYAKRAKELKEIYKSQSLF